jgi:hypothetical protein
VSPHILGMRRAIGHSERLRLARLVRTLGAMCCTQMPTRPLRMAQAERSPPDQCGGEGVSEPRGCQGPLCAYGSRFRL